MSDTNLCPCGTQQNLTDCCLPVIQGARTAKTAEELLRARYTAFTQGTVDFILSSHHSRTRNDVKRDEIEDWSKNSEWLGLKIVECQQGQANDSKGEIIFSATYRPKGKTAKEKTKGKTRGLKKHSKHVRKRLLRSHVTFLICDKVTCMSYAATSTCM